MSEECEIPTEVFGVPDKAAHKAKTIKEKVKKILKKILGWFIEANSLLFWGPWKEMKV